MAIELKSSCPAPTDRERIWAAIRELGQDNQVFTSLDLALKTHITRRCSALGEYVRGLEKAGFLRVVSSRKRGASNQYELVRDVGVTAPRVTRAGEVLPPSGRTRMWKAMFRLKTFTAQELAEVASLAEARIAVSEAEYYCEWLCRGGYLRGSKTRWTLIPAMYTGPKAPQILRVKKLYDPNRDAVVCETEPKGRDDL
jgi:hypothetical protein